jgi:hypothetical protein
MPRSESGSHGFHRSGDAFVAGLVAFVPVSVFPVAVLVAAVPVWVVAVVSTDLPYFLPHTDSVLANVRYPGGRASVSVAEKHRKVRQFVGA